MITEINGHTFTLLPEKALYKHEGSTLIIADVHLGKASHFRKAGIPMTAQAQMSDYDNLKKLFDKVKPEQVYFLGDLFHSSINRDWHFFCDMIALYPAIKFILIRGNHDLIDKSKFDELCVEVVDSIEEDGFIFTHEPLDEVPAGKINIIGHIHPGFVLSGIGRQNVKVPCFYATNELMILPAFGVLTGLYNMEKTVATKIYIVLSDSVRLL